MAAQESKASTSLLNTCIKRVHLDYIMKVIVSSLEVEFTEQQCNFQMIIFGYDVEIVVANHIFDMSF